MSALEHRDNMIHKVSKTKDIDDIRQVLIHLITYMYEEEIQQEKNDIIYEEFEDSMHDQDWY